MSPKSERGRSMATIRVNGREVAVTADPATPLLYILRNDAGVTGPHFGCGLGQCGACTVHINGEAVRSCQRPLSTVRDGDQILTSKGWARRTILIRCRPPSSKSR